jgi:crotonobetainyl-CoA:carnitine CoA-transferase CaiB-like acyl-CoA transferase
MAGLPGFDPILQALRPHEDLGGDGEEPVYHQIAVCDFITGLMTAYGVAAALYVRERSGRGQQVETSLANNAMAAQAGEFMRYEGRPPDPQGGRDVDGISALYRVYRCADGWLFLAVRTPGQAGALLRATAGALTSSDQRDAESLLKAPLRGDVASALESFFAARTRGQAMQTLIVARIPCAPCLTAKDLFGRHLRPTTSGGRWAPVHRPMRWDASSEWGAPAPLEGPLLSSAQPRSPARVRRGAATWRNSSRGVSLCREPEARHG